ncbi:porin, partial [Mesorhizobium sp.]
SYIPNTETCLRIGGYVRYDIGLGDVRSYDSARTSDVRTGEDQGTWRNSTRFTFKTWTGQQTELGALTTYTETQVNFGNSANSHDSPQNYDFNSGLALASAW